MALTNRVPAFVGSLARYGRLYASSGSGAKLRSLLGDRRFTVSAALNAERKYTEKHEWISVDDGAGTVGLSNFAQETLGELVFVQMPDVGTEVTQFKECGVVESVKAASDVYSPASGSVTEINSRLTDEPSLVNKSCYEDGWLFKMKLKDQNELSKLMDEKKYEEYLKTVEH